MKKNVNKVENSNKKITIQYGDAYYSCELDTYIKKCPKCNYSIVPGELDQTIFRDENTNDLKLSFTYLCSNCFDTFICQYIFVYGINNGHLNPAKLQYIEPKGIAKETFSEIIEDISPDFINFYNQSLNAEQMGLKDIAGPGYRKSLEFLIKDFAIKNFPDDNETIEKTPLARCIDNFIENQTIKDVAKAATWLGNDQTHYKKKHTDKNLKDLKLFINLTINWIELDENTKKAQKLISQ
ncbi:DUF4145 domain-containing protein [Bacillus thuringiensis]|uniref:DUF4145 domain-containing protein n=1 Tax=Bacillus thuringiensis TaxID=1428 RepID=UPI000A3CE276|nr:DUF4145 domain-containing protein [Bacillus thuringiensis]MED3069296.1 DUF4145 domain-containing protein [Bacillus thuringiensis]